MGDREQDDGIRLTSPRYSVQKEGFPVNRPAQKQGKAQADERNLVPSSESREPFDLEEFAYAFWEKYRRHMYVGIVGLAVIVIGYQMAGYIEERREAKIQANFQQAENENAKLTFALDHAKHPLAGYAYLQIAHEEYTDKEFRQASSHYQEAMKTLQDSPLGGRARLGYGVSLIQLGERESGLAELTKLAEDESVLQTTRAEAAYTLAIAYWEAEDFVALEKELDRIADFDQAGFWVNKSERLRTSIPQLAGIEEESAQSDVGG